MNNDFRKFAVNHLGINSNTLDGYTATLKSKAPFSLLRLPLPTI